MGWSSGTSIAEPLIEVIKANVKSEDRRETIYRVLLNVLLDNDWDTKDEVRGIDPIFDSLAFDYDEDEYED